MSPSFALCQREVHNSQSQSLCQFQFLLQLSSNSITDDDDIQTKEREREQNWTRTVVVRRLPRTSSVVFIAPPCTCRCLPARVTTTQLHNNNNFVFSNSLYFSTQFRFWDKHCHWNCAFLHTQSLLILLLLSFHALFLPPNVISSLFFCCCCCFA